jgi:capsular polysaccharide biosynthesis protein
VQRRGLFVVVAGETRCRSYKRPRGFVPNRNASCAIRAPSASSVPLVRPRSLLGVRVGARRVASFDDVPDAKVIDVEIPSAAAAPAESRTVQSAASTATAPAPPPRGPRRVAVLERCRLATSGGVVITGDGAVVMESLWDEEHYRSEFQRQHVRLRPPSPLRGEHASLVSLWCRNYYHWMLDGLPRLASLRAAGMDAVPLVVPNPPARFHRESLAHLGISPRRLTPFVNEHIAPQRLIWAPPAAHIGYASPFVVKWLRRALGQGTPARGRRLYIARTGSRQLVNEASVVDLLRRHGFEAIHPERLALVEQIRAFEAAEAIVAPHGAGLTNIVFSERLSVLEIVPPRYENHCYRHLAAAAGHDHWHLIGEDVPGRRPPRERAFSVSIELLDASVRGMLCE